MSYAICLLGFFSLPGTPFKCYSLFLTDYDIKLARKRMRINGTDDGLNLTGFLDKEIWLKMLKSWHFWVFAVGNIGGFNSSNSSSGSFALWLKSLNRYSVEELNNLTAIPPALGIIWLIITTFGADFSRKRFLMIIFAQLMNFIGNVILTIWDVNEKAKWFAFYFSYWAWSQSSVFYPLMNDILRNDVNLRSIEWVISYIIGLQSYTWISAIVWQTEEAPSFRKGFTTAAVMGIVQAVSMLIGLYFYKKDEKQKSLAEGTEVYNSMSEYETDINYENVESSEKGVDSKAVTES
ncbi:uncharacterized protein PRCAT00001472001 [Priceomyces carsonii]|uniref:uncharacterized protein n=1 Tax=Priceomyces carsonii TaxID=28549 RepID=UPI002EDB3913|nr:unnamed protein product [Priceomyces carsonii]